MSAADLSDLIEVFGHQGAIATAEGRHADAANWQSTADHWRQQLQQQESAA